jgi:hypothetical protein
MPSGTPGLFVVFPILDPYHPIRSGIKTSISDVLAEVPGSRVASTAFFAGQVTYMLKGEPDTSHGATFAAVSRALLADSSRRASASDRPPVAFLVGPLNDGNPASQDRALAAGIRGRSVLIGPGVSVLLSPHLAAPQHAAVIAARRAGEARRRQLLLGGWSGISLHHAIWAGVGLFLLFVVPGLLMVVIGGYWRRGLGVLSLIPGVSMALLVFVGIGVESVHRAALGAGTAWFTLALAASFAAVIGVWTGRRRSARNLQTPSTGLKT